MTDDDPITVEDLLLVPDLIHQRLLRMTQQRFVADMILPPGQPPRPVSRWWRLRSRVRSRRDRIREGLALRIAPWLSNREDW